MHLWKLEATELAQRIRAREVSCAEVVQSNLDRLDAVNPRLNAVVDICAEDALRAASHADAMLANGEAVGPLHGVPITVKVNVDQRGHATTNGVQANLQTIAKEDSPVVVNLLRAGAIVIGRTNTPAFSARWFTDNEVHGRTLNPHDARVTPGGSSGGAAVAIATGIGPIAHGNDLGGSIRYPAYACGVYGLRPTVGRIPSFNPSGGRELPPTVQMASTQGPLARSVRDLRLAFAAMSPHDARDPGWMPVPIDLVKPAAPVSVALCTEIPGYISHPEVSDALQRAAQHLERAGYRIEHAQPPCFHEAAELWLSLTVAENRQLSEAVFMRDGDEAFRSKHKAMSSHAKELDMKGYMLALASRTGMMREWAQFLQRHPLLLLPVSWHRPFEIDADQRGSERMREMIDAQSPLLSTAILGLPGLSVPMGLRGGLPTGVQLVSSRFHENLCLAAAQALEDQVGPVSPVEPAG